MELFGLTVGLLLKLETLRQPNIQIMTQQRPSEQGKSNSVLNPQDLHTCSFSCARRMCGEFLFVFIGRFCAAVRFPLILLRKA
jgi:hypothetical protein